MNKSNSKKIRWRAPLTAVAAGLLLTAPAARACAVCFGDPNSLPARGLQMGVLVLLGVTGVVLAGFATFFVALLRRSVGAK